jgi:hypothetical protein
MKLTPDSVKFLKERNRELEKKMCLGKQRHESRIAAEYVLCQMQKDQRDKRKHLLGIYKCQFCKAYHIGHDD